MKKIIHHQGYHCFHIGSFSTSSFFTGFDFTVFAFTGFVVFLILSVSIAYSSFILCFNQAVQTIFNASFKIFSASS
jgi:hypothetical protein